MLPVSRLLDPRTLTSIKDLRLLARTVVSGFLAGQQMTRTAGAGIAFVQHRAYQPGDDPRLVDWKMYARSDRYYVREAENERDVTVRFIVDASGSMGHDHGGLCKLDYARYLVASLAHLAAGQGERLRLHAVTAGGAIEPTGRQGAGLLAILTLLERLTAAGEWPEWSRLEPRFAAARGRELVVVVSDLHDRSGRIRRALGRLGARHEVLVLHLLARDEIEFSYRGDVELEDLETGETVRVDADGVRARYRERLAAEIADWRRELASKAIAYGLIATDEPLDRALRRYLLERQRLP